MVAPRKRRLERKKISKKKEKPIASKKKKATTTKIPTLPPDETLGIFAVGDVKGEAFGLVAEAVEGLEEEKA